MELNDFTNGDIKVIHLLADKCGVSYVHMKHINDHKRRPSPSLAFMIEEQTLGKVSAMALLKSAKYTHLKKAR